MRRSAAVVLGVVALVSGMAGDGIRGQQPSFRTSAEAVILDVSVHVDGKPVAGLTPADLVVRDNGAVQRVESVEHTAMPLDVTLVVDVSRGTRTAWGGQPSREATASKVNEELRTIAGTLRPVDRVRLLAIDTQVHQIVPMTAPPEISVVRVPSGGLSSVHDALATAMLWRPDPGRRHLIVAWTKPIDTVSAVSAESVRAVANGSDAVVHVVLRDVGRRSTTVGGDTFTLTARSWEPFRVQDDTLLADIARTTGGSVHDYGVLVERSMAEMFRDVFEEYRSGYVLRYIPQGGAREGWHDVTVTVPRLPKAEIRARRGYAVEPPPSPAAAARPRPAGTEPSYPDVVAEFDANPGQSLQPRLRLVRNLRALYARYREDGNPWPATPRREAVFVLEMATAGLIGRDRATASDAADLLTGYRRFVRHPLGAERFECAWNEAAFAVLEGGLSAGTVLALVPEASERCPGGGRMRLARAVAADQLWSTGNARATASAAARAEIDEAADVMLRYDEAMTVPDVRAEAIVRASWLAHRTGDHRGAWDRLRAFPVPSGDRVLDYYFHLVGGQVLRALDRADEAAVAYRAALEVVPGAQSPRVGLMTLLVVGGQHEQAAALAEAVQAGSRTAIDPWWLYWQGQYRTLPVLIDELRKLAQ